jgi:hypothetical protein
LTREKAKSQESRHERVVLDVVPDEIHRELVRWVHDDKADVWQRTHLKRVPEVLLATGAPSQPLRIDVNADGFVVVGTENVQDGPVPARRIKHRLAVRQVRHESFYEPLRGAVEI